MLQELFEFLCSFWICLLAFLVKTHLITYLVAHLGPFLMKFLVLIKETYMTTIKPLMTTKEKQQLQIHRIKESIFFPKWEIILHFFGYTIVCLDVHDILTTAINKLEYGFFPRLKGFSKQTLILFFHSLALPGQIFVCALRVGVV